MTKGDNLKMNFLDADTARNMACKAYEGDVSQLLEWLKPKIAEAAETGKFKLDIVIKSSDFRKNFKIADKTFQKNLIVAAVHALERHGYAADYSIYADGFVNFDNCPNPQFTIKISWE